MFPRLTVLVTGGAGFVGARLVPRLLAAGCAVRVLDRFLYGEEPLREWRSSARLESFTGDVRDAEAVARAVAGCDLVIHLATIGDTESFDLDSSLALSINLDGLATVLRQSERGGVAGFIQLSSLSIEDLRRSRETGHLVLAPRSALARCELVRETMALDFVQRGLSTVTLRATPLAGVSARMRFDLPVNRFAADEFLQREGTPLTASSREHSLHVDDLVHLVLRLTGSPASAWEGQIYDVYGAGTGAAPHGDSHCEHSLSNPAEDRHSSSPLSPSSSPLRGDPGNSLESSFGWRPSRSAEQAIREVVDALGRGDFADALTNPRYSNAESLRRLDRGALRRAA